MLLSVPLRLITKARNQIERMGPGPRFELGRKAPQASMLPSYTTPATLLYKYVTRPFFRLSNCSFVRDITNTLFLFAEDFSVIIVFFNDIFETHFGYGWQFVFVLRANVCYVYATT
jgi:hypothetical protein